MRKNSIVRNVIIGAVTAVAGLIIWATIKAFKKD